MFLSQKIKLNNFYRVVLIIFFIFPIGALMVFFWRGQMDAEAAMRIGASLTNAPTSTPNTLRDGLVGWWTFDGADVNATQVFDMSGQGNTGTRNGGVAPVGGKIGQGMSFDGDDDYIDLSSVDLRNFSLLTIAAWINFAPQLTVVGSQKIDSIVTQYPGSSVGFILDNYDGAVGDNHNNGLRFWLEGSSCSVGDGATELNVWNYVSLTYNKLNGDARLYVNGAEVKNCTMPTSWSSAALINASVGHQYDNDSQNAKGSIDDVRIYDRILSAKEIKQLYAMGENKMNSSQTNLEADINSGLVGYWTFDGKDWSSSVTTTDKSNTAEHLGIFGGAKKDVGKIGQGIYFDGVSGRGATEVTSNTDYFTLSAWVYPEIVDGNYTIIAKNDGSGAPPYLLRTSAGGIINFFTGDLTDSSTDSTTALPLNQWTHIVGIYDGVNRDLYINGVLNKHETITGSVVINSTHPISIGTWTSGVSTWIQFWKGKLDDIRVYDRALSAKEIKQLYTMGESKFSSSQTNLKVDINSGLVGYWTFDGVDVNATQVLDKSGNNNTGTKSGGVAPDRGKSGQGMSFDGISGNIQTSAVDLTASKYMSVSFWLKNEAVSGSTLVLFETSVNFNSNDGAVLIYINKDLGHLQTGIQDSVASTRYRTEYSGLPAEDNKWHFYTVVFDNFTTTGDIKIFIDGKEQSTTINNDTKDQSSGFGNYQWYFMSRAGTTFFEDGVLDDLRVYNRALTAQEIRVLYLMGK